MPHAASILFVELGAAIVGLAVLARIANRLGFSTIPLYVLGGLAFGKGGLAPLDLSQEFIHVGADIGVLLLLFMLGLEYSGDDLKQQLSTSFPAGVVDLVLNFPPGVIAGILLGWSLLPSVLLGGVTYISSSGVIAKVLSDLKLLDSPETPPVLSVLVLEDLAMAGYLPLIGVLIAGGGAQTIVISVAIAVIVVAIVLLVAVRHGHVISQFVGHQSDEVVLLTAFGSVLLAAGVLQMFNVSAAIGAFLVGIAASGPLAVQSRRLLAPLRDLFAAIFFFFFGLEIDPTRLPAVLPVAFALAVFTALTKVAAGYWAARRMGVPKADRWCAGVHLIARGEFSIVIAGLGTSLEPQLGLLSAAYVLLLAIAGPSLSRAAENHRLRWNRAS